MSENSDTKLTSVKYYVLKDENAREFFEEWKFKTVALIRHKGWYNSIEEGVDMTPPGITADEEERNEYDELKKKNDSAYDQIIMGCSGVPLGIAKRAKGIASTALALAT